MFPFLKKREVEDNIYVATIMCEVWTNQNRPFLAQARMEVVQQQMMAKMFVQ